MQNSQKVEVSEKWQILALCAGSLLSLSSGMLFSWPSPSIIELMQKNGYTQEDCDNLVIIPTIVLLITCPFPGYFIDKYGRKTCLLSISALYIASCLLNLSSKSIYVFYLGRIFSGAGDAALYAAFPIYIKEISTPKIRGTWGNLFSVSYYLGMLLVTICGGYTNIKTTAAVTLLFLSSFVCIFAFMPESPYFYLITGNHEDAARVLRLFRGNSDVEAELEVIEREIAREKSEPHGWKDFMKAANNRKSAIAIVFIEISQQTSGFRALAIYSQPIFEHVAGNMSAVDSAIIYNAAILLSSLFGSVITDKLGRRNALFMSFFGGGFVLSCVAVYFYLDKFSDLDLEGFEFIPLIFMVVYVLFWSFGIAVVPTLMLSELFSTATQRKGLIVANILFAVSANLVTKLYQIFVSGLGLCAAFAFFACCCFASSFLSRFVVPETRGKTNEEIQLSMLGDNEKKRVEL